jgi:hypothetical protein
MLVIEKGKVEYFRGFIAGLPAGFVWAFVTSIGLVIEISVFHGRIVAYVQSRIPPPQPLLPGFPEFGTTTAFTVDQLIQDVIGAIVFRFFMIGLGVGPILGIIFSWLDKKSPRRNLIVKSLAFGILANTLFALLQFSPPYSSFGLEARSVLAMFSYFSAILASLVLAAVYKKLGELGPRRIQSQLTDFQTGNVGSANPC